MRISSNKNMTLLIVATVPCCLLGLALLMVGDRISYQTVTFSLLFLGLMSLVVLKIFMDLHQRQQTLRQHLVLAQKGKDSVTGLPDQHEFLARLDVECRRSLREFTPLSVMLVGHPSAELSDVLAVNIAESLIRSVYRPGDMVARIDETRFALVLPATNERASKLAERCLNELQQLAPSEKISIALATFQPLANLSVERTFTHVQQLYEQAKQHQESYLVADAEKQLDPSVIYTH